MRTNKQYWHNGRFPHWDGLRWNFSYTFSNQTIKKWRDKIEGRKSKNEGNDANGENGEKRPEDRRPENGELKTAMQRNGAGQEKENDEKNEFVHGIGSFLGEGVCRSDFF